MSISEASEVAGVSQSTRRRWEQEGKINPERTPGGTRQYTFAMLKPHIQRKTIAHARVKKKT
ncbi:MAG: helix-turn-helix domain-containing protein [Pseudomonadota bacterium]|nr:helix-turn-helix domain-containing protein [Pseudomonadota bacterium]